MSDKNVDASEEVAPARTGSLARKALTIAIPVLIFMAGAATALIGQQLLAGGEGVDETRVIAFEDWRVVCPPAVDEISCELSANIVPGEVFLVLEDPTLGSRLRVVVPHGMFLDPGLGFSIGDQPLQIYQYETCVQNGCFALVTLDTALLELLRGNMNGEIVVVPAAGTPVTVPYSLNGFSEGYDALVQASERRASFWSFLTG